MPDDNGAAAPPARLEELRALVDDALRGDCAATAVWYADKLATLSRGAVEDELRLARAELADAPRRPLRQVGISLREDEARRAPETQRRMEEAERRGTSDWIEVATAVQRRVARESLPAGASEGDVDARVAAMRYAAQRHPEICHWVRFNRARVGDLREGDAAPDVSLSRLDGAATSLLADRDEAKPLIVVSGSLS